VWAGRGENDAFGVRGIVEDADGKFWLSNTMFRFVEVPNPPMIQDAAPSEYAHYRKEKSFGTEADGYSAFVSSAKDKGGHLWLAIMGGAAYRNDGTNWTQFLVLHEGKPTWIHAIDRDREDRMWVVSNERGIYRFDGGKFEKAKF
jgi:ligand-binding sensor domain-containing protein